MKLTDCYRGGDDPFRGDRTLWLRSLPEGARVSRAVVSLAPAKGSGAGSSLFQETFAFGPVAPGELSAADWGVTKTPAEAGPSREVDFHARCTLVSVLGSVEGSSASPFLQVDLGGMFVGVAEDGGMMAPEKPPYTVPLALGAVAPLPGLTVARFRLSHVETEGSLDVTRVTVRSAASNLSVRLGQMPPFWTRLGDLTSAETSPDFSTVLNAFLAEAQTRDGFHALPLVVHSDTLTRLDVQVDVEYVLERSVLPPHLPEARLAFELSTQPGIDTSLMTVRLPRRAIPVAGGNRAMVRGEFQPSRIASGHVGNDPPTAPAVVTTQCSLAQPLVSEQEIALTGVDLLLAGSVWDLAGLNLAVRADEDGKPSADVLAQVGVEVEKPLPGRSAWGSASLAVPLRILEKVRYWLVLQSVQGQASWGTVSAAGAPALQCSRDGGLSWREAAAEGSSAPVQALFRLRHTPESFSVPVQLQIGDGPGAVRRSLEEFAPLGRLEFPFDFSEKLGEYLEAQGAKAPCGSGELLQNGGFDEPPHDDATRRIFGFDVAHIQPTSGTARLDGWVDLSRGIDLSVQRFILLSARGVPPTRIDCSGSAPRRTRAEEIADAVNRALRRTVARVESETGVLVLEQEAAKLPGTDTLLPGELQLHPWTEVGAPVGWEAQAMEPATTGRLKWPSVVYSSKPEGSEGSGDDLVIAALVAAGHDPAVLSQRVAVAGGCSYRLRCAAARRSGSGLLHTVTLSAPRLSSDAASRWEIRWLGAEGNVIREESADLADGEKGATFVEAHLQAPEGAVWAELRFVQAPAGLLLLEDVSLAPTAEVLRNGGFRLWEEMDQDRVPEGWRHEGGWIDGKADPATGSRVALLRGDGPEDAQLAQTMDIDGGEAYELQVSARPVPPQPGDAEALPVRRRGRLELRWMGKEKSIADPLILPLDGREFPLRAWLGKAPEDAVQAEIRLVQPRGRGDLLVERVSLARLDLVSVPLLFLGESPGEMTLSDLRVTYDLGG